jgi:hypothetical protein
LQEITKLKEELARLESEEVYPISDTLGKQSEGSTETVDILDQVLKFSDMENVMGNVPNFSEQNIQSTKAGLELKNNEIKIKKDVLLQSNEETPSTNSISSYLDGPQDEDQGILNILVSPAENEENLKSSPETVANLDEHTTDTHVVETSGESLLFNHSSAIPKAPVEKYHDITAIDVENATEDSIPFSKELKNNATRIVEDQKDAQLFALVEPIEELQLGNLIINANFN